MSFDLPRALSGAIALRALALRALVALALVVLALSLSACPAGNGLLIEEREIPIDPEPEIVPPLLDATLDELEAAWAELSCGVFACVHRTRVTDEICDLAQGSRELPFDTFRRTRATLAAGRGAYDPQKGNACREVLAAIASSPDDCFGARTPTFQQAHGAAFASTCGALLVGTVPDGGACDADTECAGGGVCPRERFPDCVGQCVIELSPGASCVERPFDCAEPAFCNGSVCQSRVLKVEGELCFDASECETGKCFDYACKTVSGIDGECIAEGDCGANLYCRPLPPSTGRLGICQVPSLPGQGCGFALRCAGNQACPGHARRYGGGSRDGFCQDRPGDVGAPCIPIADGFDFGDTGCFADLVCNPDRRRCEPAPLLGAACAARGAPCGFGAYCDASSICRPKKAHGEPAAGPAECSGFFDSFRLECFDPSLRGPCG
jgi:hypothetical protein